MIGELIVVGDRHNPDKPDGDVYKLPNGHSYEMGERHSCGLESCPANTL